MESLFFGRQRVAFVLLLSYILPFAALLLFSAGRIDGATRWQLITTATTLGLAACLAVWLSLQGEESSPKQEEPRPTTISWGQTTPNSSQLQQLGEELQREQSRREKLENDLSLLQQRYETAEHALENERKTIEESERTQTHSLMEYQQTIADQREVIEKKQKRVKELEDKVKDLQYELKTVLGLKEGQKRPSTKKVEEQEEDPHPMLPGINPEPLATSSAEAESKLKRCIDMAQKLIGARHLMSDSSRFHDLSPGGFAHDLRRLCDGFESETSSVILLYSQKERKILFASNRVRDVLGWSPEKVGQNFQKLLNNPQDPGNYDRWGSAVTSLKAGQIESISISLKTRTGQDKPLTAVVGLIPTGIFKNHVVAVLYEGGATA